MTIKYKTENGIYRVPADVIELYLDKTAFEMSGAGDLVLIREAKK